MNDKPSLQKLHTTFDFDFKFDFSSTSQTQSQPQIEAQQEPVITEIEPRSPRTPTYTSTTSPTSSNTTTSPFDASKYYSFPTSSAFSPDSSSATSSSSYLSTTSSPTIIITPPTPTTGSSNAATNKTNTNTNINTIRLSIPVPPPTPLRWIWTCHLCHTRYPLGTTRRCLIDGHYYCSGVQDSSLFQSNSNANVNSKRHKRRKKAGVVACASEFDYVGWEEYMRWRRTVMDIIRQGINMNTNTNTDTNDDCDCDSKGHENLTEDPKRENQCPHTNNEIEKKVATSSKLENTVTTTMVISLLQSNEIKLLAELQGCEKCEYPSECRYEKMSVDCSSSTSASSNYYNGTGDKSIHYDKNSSNGGGGGGGGGKTGRRGK